MTFKDYMNQCTLNDRLTLQVILSQTEVYKVINAG